MEMAKRDTPDQGREYGSKTEEETGGSKREPNLLLFEIG
jgi:hypothetical protein